MKRLWACYAPYQNILFFVIAGSVLTAGLEISFPMIVRYILEDILPAGDMLRLVHTAAVLFILYVVCLCSSFCVSYFGRSMGTHIENDLRCRLFSHIESMSFSFFDNAKTGQLLSRIISDISEIGDLVFQMPNLIMVCLITMCGSEQAAQRLRRALEAVRPLPGRQRFFSVLYQLAAGYFCFISHFAENGGNNDSQSPHEGNLSHCQRKNGTRQLSGYGKPERHPPRPIVL